MGWTWQMHRAEPGAGPSEGVQTSAQPADGFPSQAEAETWVGEVWRDLLAAGVDGVSLFEDGRLVYGPMSLHPEQ